LAGKGSELHIPVHMFGEMTGERRLAGTGIAEEAEYLRPATLQPTGNGFQGLVLLRRKFHASRNQILVGLNRAGLPSLIQFVNTMLVPGCGKSSHSLRPAVHGRHAGAADLDQAERLHDGDELFDLRHATGDLENEMLGVGVDDLGAESVGEPQRFHPVVACAAHLDQCKLPLQRALLPSLPGAERQIHHAMDRHDALELVLDLLTYVRRTARNNGDARKMPLVLGLRHGEAVDVVAAPGKEADDAREYPGLVVYEHGERARLGGLGFPGDEIGGACRLELGVHERFSSNGAVCFLLPRRSVPYTRALPSASMAFATASSVASSGRSISLCALPDGIIGKQLARGATRESKITVLSTSVIAWSAASRSPGFSQRMPWQP